MKPAGLSFDIDSVASHLEGYGFPRPSDDGAAYTVGIPRILELLARMGAHATFFLIADEARRHSGTVSRITSEGHEVASHSMTHRLPFHDLDPDARRLELRGSKVLLEDLTGQKVTGFRAPSWDFGPWLAEELVTSGYRYDSSAYPSFLLPFLRAAVARRGSRSNHRTGGPLWRAALGQRRIHRVEAGGGSLIEVPMYTIPWVRLPYYHTLRFIVPDGVFRCIRRGAQSHRGPVWYLFHAVDFLSLDADGLDQRIVCHPGMAVPLERKLELAEESIRALGHGRAVVPLRELVVRRFGNVAWKPLSGREKRP